MKSNGAELVALISVLSVRITEKEKIFQKALDDRIVLFGYMYVRVIGPYQKTVSMGTRFSRAGLTAIGGLPKLYKPHPATFDAFLAQ